MGFPVVQIIVFDPGKLGVIFNLRNEPVFFQYLPAIHIDDRMETIFDFISSSESYLYYPIVEELGRIQRVVRLEDLKPILAERVTFFHLTMPLTKP